MVFKRLIVAMLCAWEIAYADQIKIDAGQALINTTQAMSRLNYQGTVVFLRNGKLETMKYSHAANKDTRQERLVSLNSPLREIVRDGGQVLCIFKATQQRIVDHRPFERSFLVDLPKNLAELDAGYRFVILGEEDIAMQPAYIIAIEPKDEFRYHRKIWVTKNQFLPLKLEVSDQSGNMLEQFVFTELEVKDQLPFVDTKALTNNVRHIHQSQTQSSAQAAFELGELPPGFKEIFFARLPVHNTEHPVDHLLLSDGMASVSIYMESRNSTLQPGLQHAGAVHSFSRVIGDNELTVMGEVPAKTVELIAQGIRLRSQ